jgi:hypothetical protein
MKGEGKWGRCVASNMDTPWVQALGPVVRLEQATVTSHL